MNNPDNLQQLQQLILKSEGKTLEDELGEYCKFKYNGEIKEISKIYDIGKKGDLYHMEAKDQCWIKLVYRPNTVYERSAMHKVEVYVSGQPEAHYGGEQVEILGLPITLSRVLRALGKRELGDFKNILCQPILSDLRVFVQEATYEKEIGHEDLFTWNLDHDYDGQSEETIQKIVELLK